MKNRTQQRFPRQRGAVAVAAAVGLVGFLGFLGLAVDLSHLYFVKADLRRAAEAGVLAGARAIFPDTLPAVSWNDQPNCTNAVTVGTQLAQANPSEGANPEVTQIQTGSWNYTTKIFTSSCTTSPFSNAVSVTTQRQNIPLYFMSIFGWGALTLHSNAIALMDFVGSLLPGKVFPFAIHSNYAGTGQVLTIHYAAAIAEGAWWYKSTSLNPNDARILVYLGGAGGTTLATPALAAGDTVRLDYGNYSTSVDKIQSTYMNQVLYCPVIGTTTRRTNTKVLGFTAFKITAINDTGTTTLRYIQGTVYGLAEAPANTGDGGGTNYGMVLPGRLVQ